MIAASVNSALGRAGLLLMLAASVVGALTVFVGVQRGDKRLLRQGARYSWMAFGGVRAHHDEFGWTVLTVVLGHDERNRFASAGESADGNEHVVFEINGTAGDVNFRRMSKNHGSFEFRLPAIKALIQLS